MARTDAIRHALLSGAGAAQNAPASPADAQPAVGAEEDEEEEYPQARAARRVLFPRCPGARGGVRRSPRASSATA